MQGNSGCSLKQTDRCLLSLHLFLSMNCCTYLLPASHDDERWYDNPRAVCSDVICPVVVRASREIVTQQEGGNEVDKASIKLAERDCKLKGVIVWLPCSDGISISNNFKENYLDKRQRYGSRFHSQRNCRVSEVDRCVDGQDLNHAV